MVLFVTIEARWDQNEIRLKLNQPRNDLIRNNSAPSGTSRSPRRYWIVCDPARIKRLLLIGLLLVWCSSIGKESISMQMDRLELNVLGIVIVQPGPELCCWPWIAIVQDACVCVFFEHHWGLHALDYFLSSVTVVDVEVDNGNTFDLVSIFIHEVGSSNSDIIDVTKSIGLALVTNIVFKCRSKDPSMMSRRPNGAKCICIVAWHNSITSLNHSSRSLQCRLPRLHRNNRIGIVLGKLINFICLVGLQLFAFSNHISDISVIMHFQNVHKLRRLRHLLQFVPTIINKLRRFSQDSLITIDEDHQPFCIFRLALLL